MGRAPCCSKVGLNRGPWTPEEDMLLTKHIDKHGEGNWRALPKAAGLLRCGKSCRLRWVNYLRPNVKRGNISEDEEDLIIMLHALLGNRWSLIAARMPGRTDNEIKNYWNTHLSKKLASRGLDPKTHKPLVTKSASHNPASAASSGRKKCDDSSASNLENSSSDDGDRQEAWETTMDLDTSSYSTGSCEEDHQHRRIPQPKVCARLHKKRQMPVLADLAKEKASLASPVSGAGHGGAGGVTTTTATTSTQSSQGKEDHHQLQHKIISNTKLFDYPSPSSVFNLYSPSPSASNSNCGSHSHSNCDSPTTTISKSNSAASIASSCSAPLVSAGKHSVDWNEPLEHDQHHESQVQILDHLIDDLLLRKDDMIVGSGGDLFKEDGSNDQFWDSLGKIELPDCSSVCQSDLWDGLTEFAQPPAATTMQMAPPSSSSSSSCLITPCSSSPSLASQLNFLQDELLFG